MPTASGMPMPMSGLEAFIKGYHLDDTARQQALQRQQQQQQFQQQQQRPTSPIGKAMSDLQQAKAMGAPPEMIKQMEQYVQRLSEGTPGMELSVDPSTGAVSFTSGRGQRAMQQEVVDGNVITKPTMATMTGHQKQQLNAVAREQALKHIKQPYLGLGASFNMARDIHTYETSEDPKEREAAADRLIKSAVSEKIVPEIASLQLGSQGIQPTVHALERQEKSIRQGWPNLGKRLSDLLPKDLQDKVVEEHNKRLQELTDVRQKYFVKGMPVSTQEKKESFDVSKLSDDELRKIAGGE